MARKKLQLKGINVDKISEDKKEKMEKTLERMEQVRENSKITIDEIKKHIDYYESERKELKDQIIQYNTVIDINKRKANLLSVKVMSIDGAIMGLKNLLDKNIPIVEKLN